MKKLHIMVGYMGFGKTTLAKKLAKEYNAVRLNNDDIMYHLLGANPTHDIFMEFKPKITDLIWKLAEQILATDTDVIFDMGAWSAKDRKETIKIAKNLNVDVLFHVIDCPIDIAKERVLKRTQEDKSALFIDENCFNMLLKKFEPVTDNENLNNIHHKGY